MTAPDAISRMRGAPACAKHRESGLDARPWAHGRAWVAGFCGDQEAGNCDACAAIVRDEGAELVALIEQDEDGVFVASCPTLPGCVSQGRTREEARTNIGEAITGYLASLRKHGEPVPPLAMELTTGDGPRDIRPVDVPAWNLVVADLRREVLLLHAALGEVLAWGVVLDDPRLDYIEVQVSRGAVDYARDVLSGREPSVEP